VEGRAGGASRPMPLNRKREGKGKASGGGTLCAGADPGFGCFVSHSRNGREGVGVPGGCSSPAKLSAPGVGRRRGRRHQRQTARKRGRGARENERESMPGNKRAGRCYDLMGH
jgi:hypothetical protein